MVDLATQLLRKGKEAAVDFEYFMRFVLNLKVEKHEIEWVEQIQALGDNPTGKRLMIIAPPGSGKSTLVGIGVTAWMIGRYPEEHYGLFVYADRPAWERSVAIRNLIEHDKAYHFTFPLVKPDYSSWDKASFRIKRKSFADLFPTLRSGGTTSSVVSYRLNGLIIDDPMDQKNSSTSDRRTKVFNNFEEAIETRLTTDAWVFLIGTRWTADDFIGRLLERRNQGGFEVVHTKALDDKGNSYWPEKYPFEELEKIRYNKPAIFAVQYQGDTTGGETQIIKKIAVYEDEVYEKKCDTKGNPIVYSNEEEDEEERGKFVEVDKYKKDLLVGIGIDTAMKEAQQNDFTCAYIGGLDKLGRIWILDRVYDRFGLPELKEKIKKLYRRWKPMNIWIEDASSGTPAVQTIRADLPRIPIETVPVTPGGTMSRANALSSHLHSGYVVFPRFVHWMEECKYNLTFYPRTEHDDDIDGLFVLVDNLLSSLHPARYYEEREQATIQMR